MERSLSVVRFIPWKFVRQFLPCTSSQIRRNLRCATSSSCRSARETSKTLPLNPSAAISVTKKIVFNHSTFMYSFTSSLNLSNTYWLLISDYDEISLENSIYKLTCADGASDEGFTDLTLGEGAWSLHIIPVLLGEWVDTTKHRETIRLFHAGSSNMNWT